MFAGSELELEAVGGRDTDKQLVLRATFLDQAGIGGRSMLGFKSITGAATILCGIEMVHMMRKRQARYAHNPAPSLVEQFEILAA